MSRRGDRSFCICRWREMYGTRSVIPHYITPRGQLYLTGVVDRLADRGFHFMARLSPALNVTSKLRRWRPVTATKSRRIRRNIGIDAVIFVTPKSASRRTAATGGWGRGSARLGRRGKGEGEGREGSWTA